MGFFSDVADAISSAFSGGRSDRSESSSRSRSSSSSSSHRSRNDNSNNFSSSQASMRSYEGNFLERAWDAVVDFARDVYDGVSRAFENLSSNDVSDARKSQINERVDEHRRTGRGLSAAEVGRMITGQDEQLGTLSFGEQNYLADVAVSVWDEDEDTAAVSNLQDADFVEQNRFAAAALARALSEKSASHQRIGAATLFPSNYEEAKLRTAVIFDPVTVIRTWDKVEPQLGEIAVKNLGSEAQANLLDGAAIAISGNFANRQGVEGMVGSMFIHSSSSQASVASGMGRSVLNLGGYDLKESWARALSYVVMSDPENVSTPQRAVLENQLAKLFDTPEGIAVFDTEYTGPMPERGAELWADTNEFRTTMAGRIFAGVVGDPLAVIGSVFRTDGLAVNPLSNEVLFGRRLEDAKYMAVIDLATMGLGSTVSKPATAGVKVIDEAAAALPRATDEVLDTGTDLLPTEGNVGTYGDLLNAGTVGDNITPHHVPSQNRMAQEGVAKNDGIAINMEHPHPGSGGRHRETFTYGTQADAGLSARDALAANARDLRSVYQNHGLYGDHIRSSIQDVIDLNKTTFPDVFAK